MRRGETVRAEIVADDSWRRELCPDCGQRLVGLVAWRRHAAEHGWGPEWFAARIRGALPGEVVKIDPNVFATPAGVLEVEAVADATWKAGIAA